MFVHLKSWKLFVKFQFFSTKSENKNKINQYKNDLLTCVHDYLVDKNSLLSPLFLKQIQKVSTKIQFPLRIKYT